MLTNIGGVGNEECNHLSYTTQDACSHLQARGGYFIIVLIVRSINMELAKHLKMVGGFSLIVPDLTVIGVECKAIDVICHPSN
jgi:hypothetical protein